MNSGFTVKIIVISVVLLIALLFVLFKKQRLLIAAYSLLALFLYTAQSKLFSFDFYLADLERSPLLGHFAAPLSIIIPGSEILLAILLFFPQTRKLGLLGSSILMTMFTVYVAWVLNFSEVRPCTCGGIIRELSWGQHLIFNIIFTSMSYWGYTILRKHGSDKEDIQRSISLG